MAPPPPGLLGATWNNGIGSAGVAPNARFLAARTCWDDDLLLRAHPGRGDRLGGRARRARRQLQLAVGAARRRLAVAQGDRRPPGRPVRDDPVGQRRSPPTPTLTTRSRATSTSATSSASRPRAPDDGLDCGAFGARSVDVAVPTQGNYTTRNGFTLGGPVSRRARSAARPRGPRRPAAGLATILFGHRSDRETADVRAGDRRQRSRATRLAGSAGRPAASADAAAAVALFQQRRGIAGATRRRSSRLPAARSGEAAPVIRPGNQDPSRPESARVQIDRRRPLDPLQTVGAGESADRLLPRRVRAQAARRQMHAGEAGRSLLHHLEQGVYAPRTTFQPKGRAISLKKTFMTEPRRRLQAGRHQSAARRDGPCGQPLGHRSASCCTLRRDGRRDSMKRSFTIASSGPDESATP